MINKDVMMERLKRSVRVIKDAPQYILADDVPGNLIASLMPDTQIVNNLSPTIQELGKKLLQAAQDGDVEEIRRLLAKGAPFTADWLGTSPLHLAAQNNHLEVCEIFLRAGMCKDTRTKVERTPLHMAAYEGNYDIVECLLKHGADADAKDMLHMTPLHWAAQNGHAEIAASLIRNGASTNATNKFDLTPMDIALQTDRADIVEVINFTIRDPLQATNHLMEEINGGSNDATEPVLHLNLQAEAVHSPAVADLPIETVLMENDSNDYLQNTQVTTEEPPHEIEEVQYTEDHATTFNESMKLLQQHGITMLPDDDSTILSTVMESGHSVVLTEAGKQALNSIKAERCVAEPAPLAKRPNIIQPTAFKKKKIITVTADQFLAMTANNANTLRIVNGKLVQGKPAPMKRIIPKAKVSPVQNVRQITNAAVHPASMKNNEVSDSELELMQQLTKARALVDAYKKRLHKTELELQKYKQKCKLLMQQNNLTM